MKSLSIKLVLLGAQLHMYTISKFQTYKSELYHISETCSVEHLNDTQTFDWSLSKKDVETYLIEDDNIDVVIGITEAPLWGNYFMHRIKEKCVVVTFYQAVELLSDANIDLLNYLLISVYKAIVLRNLLGQLNPYEMLHTDTRRCIFDMCGIKSDIIYSADKACLCDQCLSKLKSATLPQGFVSTLTKELRKIKKHPYYRILEFVKSRPILSAIVAAITAIFINILSCAIYDVLRRIFD